MKRIYFLFLSFFFFAATYSQTTASGKNDLQFNETEFDFGKILQGKPVYHNFEMVNTTNKPIKIDNVQASCGCTTPEWSKDEIGPGQTSKIKVGYNAASEGGFDKSITVQYGNEVKQLKIKGTVWKAPAGAPANASVQFLKQQTQ